MNRVRAGLGVMLPLLLAACSSLLGIEDVVPWSAAQVGFEAGVDAGFDGSVDSESDGSFEAEAEADARLDGPLDDASEAGSDARADAGADARIDAGKDAGIPTEAGVDAGFLLEDDFQRPDNSTTLGHLNTGQLWGYAPADAVWGIESDQARLYQASSDQSIGWDNYAVAPGLSDINVQVTLAAVGQYAGLTFRYSDPGDCWKLATNPPSGYELSKFVGGNQTFPLTISVAPADGDVLRVITHGPMISVYINGVFQGLVTDTDNETATGVGLLVDAGDLGARLINFIATANLTPPDGG